MSQHKNVQRIQDTIYCSACGRSWDHDDPDWPPCEKPLSDPRLEKLKQLQAEQRKLRNKNE